MNQKVPLFRRLLPWLITAVILGALILFVFVPIYSEKELTTGEAPEYYAYAGDTTPLVMENDQLLFTLDPVTTQFTVLDKATGHVWNSNPTDVESDPIALKADKERLRSTLVVSYSAVDGIVTHYNNAAYSVDNGVYEVETLEDGAIKIKYTIGRVNKTFYLPLAVPETRMNEIIEPMSKSEKRRVTDSYRLYNPAKFKASDDVPALLAKYPALNDGSMYILREGVADHVRLRLQGMFATVGYTEEDYFADLTNIVSTDNTAKAVFNASIIYRLDGGDLVVEVPYEDIRYYDDYPITYITVLPAFGAAGTADMGYMIVPDGGGAKINYNNGRLSQNNYYANMYGWDWGSERRQAVNETRCTFPMFAMTSGEESFLCMLEGNASYAGIYGDISGRVNSYNTCYSRYTVLHADQYEVSTKSNNRVYIFEAQVPSGSVVQRYRFLPTNDYVKMAASYRSYLQSIYPSLTGTGNETLPVSVEVLGSIDKTLQRFGFPTRVELPMTTFEQAGEMADALQNGGVDNLKMIYTGWSNGGLQQKVLTSMKLVKVLGELDDLKALAQKTAAQDIDLYLDGAVEFAYDSNLFDGFIAFRDAAKYTTRDRIELYPYSTIWYTPMEWRDVSYLVKPSFMEKCAANLIDYVADTGVTGLMFRDVGSILSADYNTKDLVTREESKQIQKNIMQSAVQKGLTVGTKLGMEYALDSSRLITEMDLMGGSYSIVNEGIPFYQIALHGLVEYTGPAINITGDYNAQLLKAAEYGAGLHFSLMDEQPSVLQDTFYSTYFAASFSDWGEKTIEMATQYQQAMAGLGTQQIVGHERINQDVTVTVYEGGARVYVNYSEKDYRADGVLIPARSYTVEGGR